jgi:hypothetical protein
MEKIDLSISDLKQNAQVTIAFREELNCFELYLENIDSNSDTEVKLNPKQALVLSDHITNSSVIKKIKDKETVLFKAKVMREFSEMYNNEDAAKFAEKLQKFADNMTVE